MLDQITPILITFNEQDNLPRSLAALTWAKSVLVIDSGSTDDTAEICRSFANVKLVNHPFTSFSAQCNFALQQSISTPWVLSMDADYIVTEKLRDELRLLNNNTALAGYSIRFEYLINGQPLRGSLYPPRVCLYRRHHAHYRQDGHAHKVVIDGPVGQLSSVMQHDDRKPNSRWLAAQAKYAHQEADKLRVTPWRKLSGADALRRCGLGPLLVLPYTLLVKGLIRDGKNGWEYTKQRLTAEFYLWKELFAKPRTNKEND